MGPFFLVFYPGSTFSPPFRSFLFFYLGFYPGFSIPKGKSWLVGRVGGKLRDFFSCSPPFLVLDLVGFGIGTARLASLGRGIMGYDFHLSFI